MSAEINLTPTASSLLIENNDSTIAGRSWGTPADSQAAALLIHGLGAQSGWFEAFARRLKVKRFFSVAYDQIGFGQRQTEPIQDFRHWLNEAEAVWQWLQTQVPEKPIFLMGNSMGALVAASIVNRVKPTGMVLFSPAFAGHPAKFTLRYKLGGIAKALFSPGSLIGLPLTNHSRIYRDESVAQWVQSDPASRQAVPAKLLWELLRLNLHACQSYKQCTVPLLVLTAGQDTVVHNQATDLIYRKLACQNKMQVTFPEAHHDLLLDPVLDKVAQSVTSWANQLIQHPA